MITDSFKSKFILATAFFILALGSFLYTYNMIDDTDKLSEKKISEWRLESERRDEIKSLDSLMRKVATEKAEIEAHFVYSSNPVPFLDTLERLARSVDVKVVVSTVDVARDENSLMVGLNVSGGFNSIYKFITLLENSKYDLDFVAMDIEKEGGGEAPTGDWIAAFRIKLRTFIK